MKLNRVLMSCVIVSAIASLVGCANADRSPAAPSPTPPTASSSAGVLMPASHGDASNGGGSTTIGNSGPGNNDGDRGDDRDRREAEDNDVDAPELVGTVTNLAGTCPALTFTIGTTRVTTNAATRFDDAACGVVANGDLVEVKAVGAPTAAGLIAARIERVEHIPDR